jgi:GxxExxY protein
VDTKDITGSIIGAAIRVHRELGPGLLESAYEACLCHELAQRRLKVERQKKLPLIYCGVNMQCGYRLDLLVNDTVVVELKAVERIEGVHVATVLTYLKLSKHSVALLINFNVTTLPDGIRRIVL